MDAFTYLAINYIQKLADPGATREEVDLYRQLLDSLLAKPLVSSGNEYKFYEERHLLQSYIHMDLSDLTSLSPDVHIWFLEHICASKRLLSSEDVIPLIQIYFLSDYGPLRYLVACALLSLEMNGDKLSNTGTNLLGILERIREDKGLSKDQKSILIMELIEDS